MNEQKPPTIKCPGCGVEVEWLSNCGRYRCAEVYGIPITLDPVHRRAMELKEGQRAEGAEK